VGRLRDLGNTVLVVVHDLRLIKAADYPVDMGPGAGSFSGQIVAAGTPNEVSKTKDSLSGQLLAEGTPEDVAQVKESYTGQCLKEISNFNQKERSLTPPLFDSRRPL